jgi:hypothetical protein
MKTHMNAAAAKPTRPLTVMPVVRPASAVTPDRRSGPAPWPASDSSRHRPRKVGRPISGEVSADSVITMPEPMPLPNPMIIAVRVRVTTAWVNGIRMKEIPSTTVHGTAIQRRP